jgi:hypothetical protein
MVLKFIKFIEIIITPFHIFAFGGHTLFLTPAWLSVSLSALNRPEGTYTNTPFALDFFNSVRRQYMQSKNHRLCTRKEFAVTCREVAIDTGYCAISHGYSINLAVISITPFTDNETDLQLEQKEEWNVYPGNQGRNRF